MGDHDLYYGDFERDGEDTVRTRLALGSYNAQKASLAREWLARKDQSRRSAFDAEQAEVARLATEAASAAASAAERAASAAEGQVVAARSANKIAIAALIVAALAMAISVATALHLF